MVRGVEVRMTADDINRYYNTMLPEDPELVGNLRGGVPQNDLYQTGNVEFTNQLVITPMEFWVAPDHRMKHTNLKMELGFWHVFISHSLIPRKHRTTVNFTVAMVLHCIQEGHFIDIGYLVKKEIPSLITAFCQEAGVDFGVDGFEMGLWPVDRGTWLH